MYTNIPIDITLISPFLIFFIDILFNSIYFVICIITKATNIKNIASTLVLLLERVVNIKKKNNNKNKVSCIKRFRLKRYL